MWDDQAKVPYAVDGRRWYSYDDEASIKLKVDYAKSKNLGAIMVWSIELDDFRGKSGKGTFHLLKTVNEEW